MELHLQYPAEEIVKLCDIRDCHPQADTLDAVVARRHEDQAPSFGIRERPRCGETLSRDKQLAVTGDTTRRGCRRARFVELEDGAVQSEPVLPVRRADGEELFEGEPAVCCQNSSM